MTQPPPDYDVHETVVTETVSRPASGLSPTLRMLLIALGVLALLGLAWWLFQRAKPAAVDTSTQTPVTAPVTTPVTTPSTGSGTTGNTNNATPTAPALNGATSGSTNGTTDATAPGGGTPDPTAVAPKPEGINPDQPLSGLNGSNPFKPSVIDNGDGTGSYIVPADQANAVDSADRRQGNNSAGNQPTATTAPPVNITRPESSQADISRALQTSSPKPEVTISRPTQTDTTPSVAANIPAPTLPNGRHPSSSASGGTSAAATNGKQGSSTAARNGTGLTETSNTPNGSANSSTQQPTPAAPIVPPIAGVTLPNGTALPTGTSTTTTNPGKGSSTTANLPNPGIPTVLDSDGDNSTASAPSTDVPTPAPQGPDTSAIDSYLSTNQIALNAVVLGKVNTAILKTKQGFVVATVGQPITGSDVVLQSVTADSATLSVGNQTKTIPLDNKVSHE